jgi:hypothetical protein
MKTLNTLHLILTYALYIGSLICFLNKAYDLANYAIGAAIFMKLNHMEK